MSRERAQALVEAVAAVPVCMACAIALVDCGVLVRDRIAVAQAATRAAEAELRGDDPRTAAREALPSSLRDSWRLERAGDRLTVRATSGTASTSLIGRSVEHASSVELAGAEAAR